MGDTVSETGMNWERQRMPRQGRIVLCLSLVVLVCVVMRAGRLQVQDAQVVAWAYGPLALGPRAEDEGSGHGGTCGSLTFLAWHLEKCEGPQSPEGAGVRWGR